MTCRPHEQMFIAKDTETMQELYPSSEDVTLSGNSDKYAKK